MLSLEENQTKRKSRGTLIPSDPLADGRSIRNVKIPPVSAPLPIGAVFLSVLRRLCVVSIPLLSGDDIPIG